MQHSFNRVRKHQYLTAFKYRTQTHQLLGRKNGVGLHIGRTIAIHFQNKYVAATVELVLTVNDDGIIACRNKATV